MSTQKEAKIIEQQTIQVNIALIPKNPINSATIPSEELEILTTEIYETSKPVITKFPDLFVLFDPVNQIAINVLTEQNRIIISDNRVTSYSGRDLIKFVRYADGVVKKIFNKDNSIIAYGLNILSIIDTNQTNSSSFLLKKFINTKEIDKKLKLTGSGIRLIYKEKKYRGDLRLEPFFVPENIPTKSIRIEFNAHFGSTTWPDLSELSKEIGQIYEALPILLAKII